MTESILLLHPGEMGASIGAALRANNHAVGWVSQSRSYATRQRAAAAGLTPAETLEGALANVENVISVCPPDAAVDVARSVRDAGFGGVYVDANAVSPATSRRIADIAGDGFVDGGIIGPPARRSGATRLYLCGELASRAASWFEGSLVDARVVDCSASALKMCYAAYTKGSSALMLAVRALAASQAVADELLSEWNISQPDLAARSDAAARGTSGKAWRFEGEMREIAATFSDAGLPSGFHEAASDIYRRMSELKTVKDADIERVIAMLLASRD